MHTDYAKEEEQCDCPLMTNAYRDDRFPNVAIGDRSSIVPLSVTDEVISRILTERSLCDFDSDATECCT